MNKNSQSGSYISSNGNRNEQDRDVTDASSSTDLGKSSSTDLGQSSSTLIKKSRKSKKNSWLPRILRRDN